ncbi:MAG: hypothetical protein AB7I50_05850 [Vicinamibacterales bacterium]
MGLFLTGIGFVIASGRAPREAPRETVPDLQPVATIKQVMNGITMPNAQRIYGAVATISSLEGIKEIAPQTDEDWSALADSATALIESGNLLLMGSRAVDTGDWVAMTRSMMDAGRKALAAAEAKSVDGTSTAAGDINVTCDNCHAKYQRQ